MDPMSRLNFLNVRAEKAPSEAKTRSTSSTALRGHDASTQPAPGKSPSTETKAKMEIPKPISDRISFQANTSSPKSENLSIKKRITFFFRNMFAPNKSESQPKEEELVFTREPTTEKKVADKAKGEELVFSRDPPTEKKAEAKVNDEKIMPSKEPTTTEKKSDTSPMMLFGRASAAIGSSANFLKNAENKEFKGHLTILNDSIKGMANKNPELTNSLSKVANISAQFTKTWEKLIGLKLESHYKGSDVSPDAHKNMTDVQKSRLGAAKEELGHLLEQIKVLEKKVGKGEEKYTQIAVEANITKMLKEVNQLLATEK